MEKRTWPPRKQLCWRRGCGGRRRLRRGGNSRSWTRSRRGKLHGASRLRQSQRRHSRVSFGHERSARTALFFCRLKAEEELQKKEDEKARRDYIKNEYMRRKQLKLMEEMGEVIKPRTGSLKKKPRPKSIHRDVVESTPLARMTGKNNNNNTNLCRHSVSLINLLSSCRGASSRLLCV